MVCSLLIGFEYSEKHNLPGTILDLYNAWKWCQTFSRQIYILTDISEVSDAIAYRHPEVTPFWSQVSKFPVHNLGKLQETLSTTLQETMDRVVIYYTGHGLQNSLLLPDQSQWSSLAFRDYILGRLNFETEIFWILDCCNPQGLNLPYQLENNRFVVSKETLECVTQPILLITSSNSQEESVATRDGSLFSRYLFENLSLLNSIGDLKFSRKRVSVPIKNNRNLKRLLGKITSSIQKVHSGYTQTVSIYSSYYMDPILWLWIGQIGCDVVTDLSLSFLVVRQVGRQVESKPMTSPNPYDSIYPE